MPEPLTVGLFLSTTQNAYESALYNGVVNTVCGAGSHLICFTSGALRSYRGFEFQRNVLYDLVTEQNVDGLIISGTLSHPISAEEMQAFFQRYQHIPKVSLALNMPGTPCVMVDSRQGVRAVVTHLLEVHGYRRLAFIRGPLGQQEAEERYQAFCETLLEYGLEPAENLVVGGDYSFNSGAAAMRELLQRPQADCQVVVAANDSMALGAMAVLDEAGVAVPGQIALTGFDDAIQGRFARVPLTSVRQNVYEQGVLAARLLLDQIAGRAVAEKNISPAHLVVRQSCGFEGFMPSTTAHAVQSGRRWSETLRSQEQVIVEQVFANMSHIPAPRVAAWVETWLTAIAEDLKSGAGRAFMQSLEAAQREGFNLGVDLAVWQRSLAAFFHQIRRCLPEPHLQETLDHLAEQARSQLGVTMERLENARHIEIENRDLAMREISESLMTTFNLAGILDVLGNELPRLNVHACYLSLFEDPQNPASLARLIFGWRDGSRLSLAPDGIVFPSQQLMPGELRAALDSSVLVVEALYSKEDRLGFMLLDVEARSVAVTNALRAMVSSALQGVLLLEQRHKAEARLLQSQGQLQALVDKLELANSELESFSYSVSHDLRSPLRSIAGYSNILEREYRHILNEDGRQLLDRIITNTKRMGLLIDDLLAFSRVGRHHLTVMAVDMNRMVRDVIEEILVQTGERQIDWQLADLPPASVDPSLMRQVWVNLINNAVKYSAKTSHACIQISAKQGSDEIIYAVRDNGVGFDMRYADKLFGVFQRLHHEEEFPGTGIGLAIVKQIIVRHGGRIWAESVPDAGAVFYFALPIASLT